MSRNGIELKTSDGRRDALALLTLSDLQVVGIMTHFPVEDAAEMRQGLAVFNRGGRRADRSRGADVLHCWCTPRVRRTS